MKHRPLPLRWATDTRSRATEIQYLCSCEAVVARFRPEATNGLAGALEAMEDHQKEMQQLAEQYAGELA